MDWSSSRKVDLVILLLPQYGVFPSVQHRCFYLSTTCKCYRCLRFGPEVSCFGLVLGTGWPSWGQRRVSWRVVLSESQLAREPERNSSQTMLIISGIRKLPCWICLRAGAGGSLRRGRYPRPLCLAFLGVAVNYSPSAL